MTKKFGRKTIVRIIKAKKVSLKVRDGNSLNFNIFESAKKTISVKGSQAMIWRNFKKFNNKPLRTNEKMKIKIFEKILESSFIKKRVERPRIKKPMFSAFE